MIQNIKVDTIYYLTNSDFEMEFNLCGTAFGVAKTAIRIAISS